MPGDATIPAGDPPPVGAPNGDDPSSNARSGARVRKEPPRVGRIDAFQRRHTVLGFPVAVVYKFVDDQGIYLTALLAHYAFVSLFPLLLLGVTVLGYVLQSNEDLQQRLVTTALQQVPVLGDQLGEQIRAFGGSGVGILVGLLGLLYGALGVAQAGQNALNLMWLVPRNQRPNPVAARLRSVGLLIVFGIGVLTTSALTLAAGFSDDDLFNAALVIPVSMVANALLVAVLFRYGTTYPQTWRTVAPGAILAGIFVHLLQLFGAFLLSSGLDRASALYGPIGVVLGIIAWITLEALVIVFCAEINVVLQRRLWPRALLTPFTDSVELTAADRAAYTAYAVAQTHKGFEHVTVSFEERGLPDAVRERPPDGHDRR